MEAQTLALVFMAASQSFDLPPGLLEAICWVESRHVADATNLQDHGSPSLGLCQVKLETVKGLGFSGTKEDLLRNPQVNAHFAAKYVRRQLDRYHGDVEQAIAAYNAGSCRFNPEGQIKNRRYVGKVLSAWQKQQ